jgi:hypothetical protein
MASFFFIEIQFEIFYRNPQKAEALSFLFAQMFMMLLVCAPQSKQVTVMRMRK